MKHTLVAYFSATGTTALLAKKIADMIQSDLYEIIPRQPYSDADLNWRDPHSRSSLEMKDETSRPELKERNIQLDQYDTILLGFPIWWYTAPAIIRTFVENNDLSGKRVILFATSGGSGLGETAAQLTALCPDAHFENGRVLPSSISDQQLRQWLESYQDL